jgi:hypothetical protein
LFPTQFFVGKRQQCHIEIQLKTSGSDTDTDALYSDPVGAKAKDIKN